MNPDYLLDYHSYIMERLQDHCKCCPNAKKCHEDCTENECANYQEIEKEICL